MTYDPERFTDQDRQTAKDVSNALNIMSSDGYKVGALIAQDHRTLQQSFARVMVGFIDAVSAQHDENRWDDRNKGTVEMAAQIRDMWAASDTGRPHLPFI